ncbi:molybdenum cofactor biosynthesis protein MoaE [Deferribacterales bacterium Es71-Z0220]|uniref:molybdenum cofactor biosynthesis protein MoaE n=1 Tax=Deferrivibrio essentukiensis TaxID=2880922 RepID=UPI001F6072D9|nr:molybdenum cofactor biosynthesis protein MoaE [Deferrivibrio essentukiensis]MCB4203754.1 molybdenum cofactor biosynthesis protein MoaE [Deferrivibrio essentukiensis]
MNLKVYLTDKNIDYMKEYDNFYENLDDSTGTILIHHGKAKYPGKYIENYTEINLFLKDEKALEVLREESEKIYKEYNLNKLFVIHRIGKIKKNDSILFLACEAKDRIGAFDGVRALLEFIKAENLIGLEEI